MEQTQLANEQITSIVPPVTPPVTPPVELPIILPKVHIPQIPPRQAAQNRLVYASPTLQQQQQQVPTSGSGQHPSSSLHLPPRYTQNRFAYVAPTYVRRPTIQISPAGFVTILKTPPDRRGVINGMRTGGIDEMRTGGIDHAQEGSEENPVSLALGQQDVINQAPTKFHGERQKEMGAVETLFGCSTLLVIAILVLAILYYLAT